MILTLSQYISTLHFGLSSCVWHDTRFRQCIQASSFFFAFRSFSAVNKQLSWYCLRRVFSAINDLWLYHTFHLSRRKSSESSPNTLQESVWCTLLIRVRARFRASNTSKHNATSHLPVAVQTSLRYAKRFKPFKPSGVGTSAFGQTTDDYTMKHYFGISLRAITGLT